MSQEISIDKDKVRIIVLIDGSRIIAQVHSSDQNIIKMDKPIRIIIRPINNGRISVDMMTFLVGAKIHSVDVNVNSIMYSYIPDENIFTLYMDALKQNQLLSA